MLSLLASAPHNLIIFSNRTEAVIIYSATVAVCASLVIIVLVIGRINSRAA